MKIQINTQSSIRIEGSKVLYFDPFRITTPVNDCDMLFITHGHFDHFDPDSITNVANEDTVFVAPASLKKEISEIAGKRETYYLKPGDEAEIPGVMAEAVPAYNMGKAFHKKENEWLGYVVTLDDERIYVAGDTDALKELAEIRCDTALVPIGGTYTMTAKEAAELINLMGPKRAIPTHYGSIVGSSNDADVFKSFVNERTQVEILL